MEKMAVKNDADSDRFARISSWFIFIALILTAISFGVTISSWYAYRSLETSMTGLQEIQRANTKKINEFQKFFDDFKQQLILEARDEIAQQKRAKRETGDDVDDEQAVEDLSSLPLYGLSLFRGTPGAPGQNGKDGERGLPGPIGLPGIKGDRGEKGEEGRQGAIGRDGRDGIPGPKGDKGDKGEPGQPSSNGDCQVTQPSSTQPTQPTPSAPVSESLLTNLTTRILSLEQSLNLTSYYDYGCPVSLQKTNMKLMEYGGKCYALHMGDKRWEEALSHCRSLGLDLLSIENAEEQAEVVRWLENVVQLSSFDDIWLGGQPLVTNRSAWIWVKTNGNSTVMYTNWARFQPSRLDNCLALENRMWFGRQCAQSYKFICQGEEVKKTTSSSPSGTVFVRWGKRSCPESTEQIYSGVIGGTRHDATGGGVDFQCLPPNPELEPYFFTGSSASYISSVEYESQAFGAFPNDVDDKQAVCSVCYTVTRSASLMIPAKKTCPTGWKKEYDGFIMSSKDNEIHPSNYICIDGSPDYMPISITDAGGRLWFVNVDCSGAGSLGQCDKYIHGRQLTCVVCSR